MPYRVGRGVVERRSVPARKRVSYLFGYEIGEAEAGRNDYFPDKPYVRYDSGKTAASLPHIRVIARDEKAFTHAFFPAEGLYGYLWGIPVHPRMPPAEVLDWCVHAVVEEEYARFRQLLGTFALVVDDPVQSRVTLVTDVLGIRPLFLGFHSGRAFFGSDAWELRQAGLASGAIDYDAVSSWIAYGYNCTPGSLFTDLRRIPAGAAVCIEGERTTVFPYASFEESTVEDHSTEAIAENLHARVSSSMEAMLSRFPNVSLALSGGFDSRYLAALAMQRLPQSAIDCGTVGVSEAESTAAMRVAESLGLHQKLFPVRGSEWDIHAEVHHFMADGFPISKSVTHYLAHQLPPAPMINGFMGDSIMRGSHDRIGGKLEAEYTSDLAQVLQDYHESFSYDVVRPEVARKIRMRAKVPMEHGVRAGASSGKIFGWVDFNYRQRHYISNNFLQHLQRVEALLPFYSWSLLSFKMNCSTALDDRIYAHLFSRYFPKLADIPHASDLQPARDHSGKMARCARRWSRQLLRGLANRSRLSALNRKRAALMLAAGLAGDMRAESSIFSIKRLDLLEERCRLASVDLDWDRI